MSQPAKLSNLSKKPQPAGPPAGDGAVPPHHPILDTLFQSLLEKFEQTHPGEDSAPLTGAFQLALRMHAGQKRDSGEPYLVHPLEVAHILAGMTTDRTCLITGILHDIVEDTGVTIEEIRKQFGDDVAACVDGVTKLAKLKFYSREERQAESVRKMLLAMVEDIRVVLVKLADRLHNMRTLDALSVERQKRIAQETLEIYAPIAHRLGMGKVRAELEDLGFRYTDPDAFHEIMESIESKRKANQESVNEIRAAVEVKLRREGIPARIEARLKRPYSIWQKLKRQKISIDQVYDLLAVRIITDSVKNCYAALGTLHGDWHPIPGRIKDFIAIPRPNLYQSLHTSVIGPGGQPFEIQIRTEEMHRIAEDGIAAHWKYKEGGKGVQDEQQIAWLRQLVEWQREMHDPGEFMSTLKVDLYPEEVYTFTPKGKVIVLPRDATPIDFAYAIHTEVGNQCVGAKVNNRIVPLKYNLKNGDVVDILTQSGHLPSKDWLSIVKTSKARNKIKAVINTTERARSVEIGEKYLEKEARRLGVQWKKVTREQLLSVASEYGFPKMEDLHAALGYGKFSARQVLIKLAPEQVEAAERAAAPAESPSAPSSVDRAVAKDGDKDLVIRVKGIDDIMVYRAKCCNPIRGEQIVGYITRGKGVAVHSMACTNVQNLMYEVERKIAVEWVRATDDTFAVRLTAYADDRPGILSHLTSVVFHEGSNIKALEAQPDDQRGDGSAIINVVLDVKDKKQLERVVAAVRRISGIRDVERVQ